MSCCGGNCAGCPGGGCSGCAGKGGAITLHPAEIDILRELAVCPFLPVGLNSRTGEPFCLEFPDMDEKIVPLALSVLEKRGFIRIDYDIPLAGFAYEGYEVCFRRGKSCPYRQRTGRDRETGGSGRKLTLLYS